MDIDSIPVGSRFADHIEKSLKDCSVVVAMIGRDWLSANPVGSRRIDEIDDYVRSEIRYAIQRGIPIVPLLLDGAAMPSVSQLPDDISSFASWNATVIRHERFGDDIDRALAAIESVGALPRVIRDLSQVSGAIAVVRKESRDRVTDAGIQTQLTLVLKNNSSRSVVLQEGVFSVVGQATMQDCNHPQYSLMTSSWTYDVDITGARSFQGKHFLRPNEVETFDVVIARSRGGPNLTVYKTYLDLFFDEAASNVSIPDIFVRVSGPAVIQGMFTRGVSPEDFCQCMQQNIKDFERIGYDLRQHIHPKTLEMIERMQRGEPLIDSP